MANIVVVLLGNIVDLANIVVTAALAHPLSIVLVVAAVVLWVFAFGLFGYLTIGGIFSGVIPETGGRTPPRQDE